MVHALCGQARAAAGRQGAIRAWTVPPPLPLARMAGSTWWPRVKRHAGPCARSLACTAPEPSAAAASRGAPPQHNAIRDRARDGYRATLYDRNACGLEGGGRAVHRGSGGRQPRYSSTHPHATANDMVAVRQHPRAGKLRIAWQLGSIRRHAPFDRPADAASGRAHGAMCCARSATAKSEIRSLHADGVVEDGVGVGRNGRQPYCADPPVGCQRLTAQYG